MSKKSLLHDRSFLSKQVPKSAKYSHIGPSIDTGSSTLNHLRKLKDNHVPHKYLDNELFVRLKPVLLGRLIYETQMEIDVAAVEDAIVTRMTSATPAPQASRPGTCPPTPYPGGAAVGTPAGDRPIYSRNHPHPMHSADSVGALMNDRPLPLHTPTSSTAATPYPYASTPTAYYAAEPLISGPIHGSRALLTTASHTTMLRAPGQHGQRLNGSADSGHDSRLPYLLLDVREASAWAKCHIVGAVPYPAVFIKRDQMSRDLVMYRNREDKVIVLYDDDETIAVPAAQTLAERGFTNVYVLSGGLNHLTERISGILIGTPPTPKPLRASTRAASSPSSSTPSLPKIQSTSFSAPTARPRPSGVAAGAAAAPTDTGMPAQSGVFNMHDLERSLHHATVRSATPALAAGRAAASSRAVSRMSVASSSTRSVGSPQAGTRAVSRAGGLVAEAPPAGELRAAAARRMGRGLSQLGRS